MISAGARDRIEVLVEVLDRALREARDDRERARAMVLVADALARNVTDYACGELGINRLRAACRTYWDARQRCVLDWPNADAVSPESAASRG